jgi:hypothetical protein
MMYHSYAMQVHGYVTPTKAMDVEEVDAPLVLVHGVRAFALLPPPDPVFLRQMCKCHFSCSGPSCIRIISHFHARACLPGFSV